MLRRDFILGTAGVLVTAGCGSPPNGPGGVDPPPQPTPTPTPTPTPPPPTLRISRILAFGDSMTAGTTSVPISTLAALALDAGLSQSYPNKLQSMLAMRYSGQTISVLNGGIAGKKVTDAGERDRLSRLVRDNAPELVILLEGANDLNNVTGPSTNDFINFVVGNMEDMVKEMVARNTPVFVATLPEQRPGQPNTQNAALVPRYNSALRVMADKKGGILIDLNAQFPLSLIGQDGLHPTESGYAKFAEIFAEAIRARYESAPSLSTTR
jgi:lysophospholipase L1-like esterase